jgi:hypothetical protein
MKVQKREVKMKYCVWFPFKPKKVKFFTDRFKAFKYLNKQKDEAYLNNNVGTAEEDIIGGTEGKVT